MFIGIGVIIEDEEDPIGRRGVEQIDARGGAMVAE